MKKHITTIILILLAATLLVACRNSDDNNNETEHIPPPSRDETIIDSYIFRSSHLLLDKLPEPASGVLVDGERIVYWYTDSTPQIMIWSIATNVESAVSMRVAVIPVDGWRVSVGGLQITGDGNIELIKVEDFEDGSVTVTHALYETQGVAIFENDLTEIIKPVDGFVHIEKVVFTDDGNIAIVTKGRGTINDLYLLDSDGKPLGQLTMDSREDINKLRDGRVVISEFEGLFVNNDTTNLRVLDFETAERDETISVPIQNAHQLILAGINQPFDILLSDGRYIYGYNIETNTLTPLLDWMETSVIATYNHYKAVLPDDRITVIKTELISTDDEDEWHTDFYFLTRTSRAEVPPKTTITIGGTGIPTFFITSEILRFNQENEYYHIEIVELSERSRIGRDRLRLEIIAGRGPDILYDDPTSTDFMTTIMFTDLYPFIDADPRLDRSDFLPGVLRAFETTEGSLPYLSRNFNISTNIALRETAERIGPLTFTNLLRAANELDVLNIFGRDHYIIGSSIESIGAQAFIDAETNRAYFDSDEFISLLEMTARLQIFQSYNDYMNTQINVPWVQGADIRRVRDGEQLLKSLLIDDPGVLHFEQALIGDIVAVGVLTRTGGQHQLHTWERFGININSQHKDAAWEFIRSLILPDASTVVKLGEHTSPLPGIPIRVDRYEERIASLMTPKIVDGVEVPKTENHHGLGVSFYAMTEDEVLVMNELINSLVMDNYDYDEIFWEIYTEVTTPFFLGTQSAADTARILQNRIQRVLDERE